MAHECTDCGMICHCNGDIDDLVLDDSAQDHCRHICEVNEDDDCPPDGRDDEREER